MSERSPDEQLAWFGQAISHPLRVRMLLEMLEYPDISPNQLHKIVGSTLPNIAYHMRYLADRRVVQLRRTAPRRGALEHYYAIVGHMAAALKTLLAGAELESKEASVAEAAAELTRPASVSLN